MYLFVKRTYVPGKLRFAFVTAALTLSTAAHCANPSLGFFVAKGIDGSANLGGLAGADAQCKKLARTVGVGERDWRAYLSVAGKDGSPAIHARDRIGAGPWFNANGALVARNVAELHSDLQRIDRITALDEHGARASRAAHDVLTGTDADGRLALIDGRPATCDDWTSSGNGIARIGHDDRMDANSHDNKRFPHWNGSWNSEHDTIGCGADQLAETGGAGGFYCFAADESPATAPATAPDPDRRAYTFAHGVNLNHWLGDNVQNEESARSLLYGADWFDEEDVAWIAAQGFDHLRIWVAGNRWLTDRGDIDEAAISHFDQVLKWTKSHHLGVVLAMHGLPGYRTGVRYGPAPTDVSSPFTDEATRGDAAYLWWAVAKRYASVGPQLRFELLTYPGAEDSDQIRRYNADTLAAVRRVDTDRVVYLTTRNMRVEHIADIDSNDPKTALVLQMWEPMVFTRQFDPKIPPIEFPGKVPDLTAIVDKDAPELRYSNAELDVAGTDRTIDDLAAKARAVAAGREVYIGVFGTIGSVDRDSSQRYLRAVRRAFARNGLQWAVYDYHTGGAVRADGGTGGPTHIHAALFSSGGP